MVVNKLAAPTDTIVNIAVDYYGRNNFTAEFQKASRLKALMGAAGKRDDLATAIHIPTTPVPTSPANTPKGGPTIINK